MGASTRAWRKRRDTRTDSSVEQGLGVEVRFSVATRWMGPTTRGQCFPVNAGDRGDGRLLPGRGTLRRVNACEDGFGTRAPPGWRAGGIFGFHEARNGANPTVGCRVQQTCELPRGQIFGSGFAAEQTVGAGRNGKDGTSLGPGSPGPKGERRFIREWTQRQCCRRRGRIDEPHERSPPAGSGLRTEPGGWDRANRCVSLKRSHKEVSTHHWSAQEKVVKAKRPTSSKAPVTTRSASAAL